MTAAVDVDDASEVHLRLMLKRHGDLVSPVPSPIPATEPSEQILTSAQWLTHRPGLAIKVRARVSLDQWQEFCRACNDGSVGSDPAHAALKTLYAGRGGYVVDSDTDGDSPPAYDGPAETPTEASQSTRKRQRTNLRLDDADTTEKDMIMRIRVICNQVMSHRQDLLITQLNAQIRAMEERIMDGVVDRISDMLNERIADFRDELQGDLDDEFDRRCDAIREDIKKSMEEQAKELVKEQLGTIEEEIVEKVMDQIADQ